jgi:RNA polymerase sigma-70 factor (ECF subfamily)
LKQIIRSCREGDPHAWHDLIERTTPLVYAIAYKFDLATEEVEDVVQESYLALYRYLDKLQSDEAIPRWLAVTSARFAKRAKDRRMGSNEVSISHPDYEEWERWSASPSLAPEDALALKEGLSQLPDKCQEVLKALFFEGLSYTEAAAKLEVAVGSLGSLQARCLERLADLFKSEVD